MRAHGPIVIDRADERGVPLEAHCDECAWTWRRPPEDPYADTLPMLARHHESPCPACAYAAEVGRPGCTVHYPAFPGLEAQP